jgi:hypothetical protein
MLKNRSRSVRIFYFLSLIFSLSLLGCGTTSDERIAVLKTGIDKATALSAEADKYIAVLDSQLIEADRMLADPATATDQTARIREVIAKIQSEKDLAAKQKASIDAALVAWTQQIDAITAAGSANIGTELQIIGTGLTAGSPMAPGPAAGYLYLIGTLIGIVGAGIGKVYQSRKDSPHLDALPEVIKGVDDVLAQIVKPADVEKAKQLLMLRQSSQTQAIVGDIKNP